jgi:cysteine desulfurase/selenocysteine lyase
MSQTATFTHRKTWAMAQLRAHGADITASHDRCNHAFRGCFRYHLRMSPFELIRSTTIGINATLPVIDLQGRVHNTRRTYLDSAATCLQVKPVADAIADYLAASCANSHTQSSVTGRDTTAMIAQAHADLGHLVGAADGSDGMPADSVIFMGSGATAAMCFVADAVRYHCDTTRDADGTPSRKLFAVVSSLEHHSNLIPWQRRFSLLYVNARLDGNLDMDHLREVLSAYDGQIAAVAVTAVSNITGVMPPIAEIATLTHAAGALLVVDAAQAASHVPLSKSRDGVDVLVGSGHKMYAPGSPGWIVANRTFFDGLGWHVGAIGGGSVDRVEPERVKLKEDPSERYEAGTPNIPGIIGLGAACCLLEAIGMDRVQAHEQALIASCMEQMQTIGDGLVVYGPIDPKEKTAVIAFNVGSIPNSALASILSNFFAIDVRNGCFCAQPYARQQIAAACEARGFCEPIHAGKTGMVRASFGIYSDESDVTALITALRWIVAHRDELSELYHENDDGSWQHNWFRPTTGYDYRAVVERFVAGG